MVRRGTLFVVSGPSGVGKGTVVRRLLERRPDLTLSVSATTRPRRPSEQDGVHYSFLSEQEFDHLVGGDALLEWAEVFGSRYGTPAVPVERALAEGGDVILEIDVQGAGLVKERVPEAVLIFLVPPSMEELERRLRDRGTEDEERLATRLATAGWEMEQRPWFDHVVVNDDVNEATAQVE
ncbi:MAG TPA: guanylate kinase, partial [Actinomycetota bacterium]|nr:guanylate kinase [Actinomycetota bacterium]